MVINSGIFWHVQCSFAHKACRYACHGNCLQ